MLVALNFCHKDAQLALGLAQWMADLGGVQNHTVLITCNRRAHASGMDEQIAAVLQPVFQKVFRHHPSDEVEVAWAMGESHSGNASSPNHLFQRTVGHIRDFLGDVPYLWLEADSGITGGPAWLDRIDAAYQEARSLGKPFMGNTILTPTAPPHMSGNAVYHQVWLHCPDFQRIEGMPFDLALAPMILAKMHETKLIQHEWRPPKFERSDDLARIRPDAVIYHQCKDGGLIRLLRERSGLLSDPAPKCAPGVASAAPADVFDNSQMARPQHEPVVPPAPQIRPWEREVTQLRERVTILEATVKRLEQGKRARNPQSNGVKPPTRTKRQMSPERRKKLSASLEKARAARAAKRTEKPSALERP